MVSEHAFSFLEPDLIGARQRAYLGPPAVPLCAKSSASSKERSFPCKAARSVISPPRLRNRVKAGATEPRAWLVARGLKETRGIPESTGILVAASVTPEEQRGANV